MNINQKCFYLKIFLLATLFLFCSCARVRYKSGGDIPVFLNKSKFHRNEKTITLKRNFYLWGLHPYESVVFLDEEFKRRNLTEVSGIEIKEYMKTSDTLISIFSFGLIIPRRLEITGSTL